MLELKYLIHKELHWLLSDLYRPVTSVTVLVIGQAVLIIHK